MVWNSLKTQNISLRTIASLPATGTPYLGREGTMRDKDSGGFKGLFNVSCLSVRTSDGAAGATQEALLQFYVAASR